LFPWQLAQFRSKARFPASSWARPGITTRARRPAVDTNTAPTLMERLQKARSDISTPRFMPAPLAASAKEPNTTTKSYHLPRLIRALRRIPFDKGLTARLAGEG
jgi:hypothetical protein